MFSSNTAILLRQFTDSFPNSTSSCTSTDASEAELCRDDDAALFLKTVAIVSILLSSVIGVAIPLVKHRFLRANSNLFVAAKAFAAGVILATGFVHMLPDGSSNLSDPCLPEFPWSKFPFAGFLAMMAALVTLVADFVGTQLYEKKQQEQKVGKGRKRKEGKVGGGDGVEDGLLEDSDSDSVGESGMGNSVGDEVKGNVVFGEEDGGGMHIVGIRAHAAHHRHSHPHHGQKGCDAHVIEFDYGGRDVHGHIHGHDAEEEEEEGGARHVVVSQVLELGIVSHSVIIGLSLGVSNSPCTIRPLIAALSFHQFFEGFALGGCISQAQFRTLSTVVMACFFAITTPAGIAGGIGLSSFYDPDSPRALIIEGMLCCISAGILVYMALVDLIAADFMSKRMRCSFRLQVISYFALFLGALLMSAIAVWE